MKKVLKSIACLLLVMAFVPVVAFADAVVTNGTATISGQEAGEQTILIKDAEDNIMFLDQYTVGTTDYVITFDTTGWPAGTYTVLLGGAVSAIGKDAKSFEIEELGSGFTISGTIVLHASSEGDVTETVVTATPAEGASITGTVLDDGTYTIIVPAGTYDVTIAKTYYITKTYKSEEISDDKDLGTIKLIAGDTNEDNQVELEDLTNVKNYAGRNSGSANWEDAVCADITEDNQVELEDLTIILANGGRNSSDY